MQTPQPKVNRERVTEIRDYLLTVPEEHFSMNSWGRPDGVIDCKSPACLAGHVRSYFITVRVPSQFTSTIAADILGLDQDQMHDLFMPRGVNDNTLRELTSKHAAEVLTDFLSCGKFDWNRVIVLHGLRRA